MFGVIPRRAGAKPVCGEGGILTPFGFPLLRRSLFPEFDRMFERIFRDWDLPEMKEIVRGVEVEEKPTEIVVRAEAPGFKPEEFDVEVRDEYLTLHAVKEKKPEVKEKAGKKEEKEEKEYVREEFREVVMLPAPVAAEKAAAKYVNGVLIVTLPKAEEVKGRRVPVTVG